MTAINVLLKRSSNTAVVLTDGTGLTEHGVIASFGTKVFPLAHMDTVIAVRGHHLLVPLFGAVLGTIASNFDELKQRIVDALKELIAGLPPGLLGCFDEFEVVVAGVTNRGPEGFAVMNHDRDGVAWQIIDIPENVTSPWNQEIAKDFWSRSPDFKNFEHFDPIVDGIKVMECQRKPVFHALPGRLGLHVCVGGYVHLTEVRPDSITMRIIHRWPEDKIGERIDPGVSAICLVDNQPN